MNKLWFGQIGILSFTIDTDAEEITDNDRRRIEEEAKRRGVSAGYYDLRLYANDRTILDEEIGIL